MNHTAMTGSVKVMICLLIGAFSPLTFKLLINTYLFSFKSYFSNWFCISSLFFFLFLLLWFSFALCLSFLGFVFCESTECFWFVVTLFFKYVNLSLYLFALDWESYRLKHTLKKCIFSYFLPLHFILMSFFTSSHLPFYCLL